MQYELHVYMGCSDVSEFEHIYGQILTTPSCVYGRLFTWIRMVDFNALIVRNTFIDTCFSIKSSLWALTAAYIRNSEEWLGRWYKTVATSHVPLLSPHRNAGRLTGKKLNRYNCVISGWVKPLQVLKRNSDYDSHDATSPSFSPILPPTSVLTRQKSEGPLTTLFNEGLGITMGKLWN